MEVSFEPYFPMVLSPPNNDMARCKVVTYPSLGWPSKLKICTTGSLSLSCTNLHKYADLWLHRCQGNLPNENVSSWTFFLVRRTKKEKTNHLKGYFQRKQSGTRRSASLTLSPSHVSHRSLPPGLAMDGELTSLASAQTPTPGHRLGCFLDSVLSTMLGNSSRDSTFL